MKHLIWITPMLAAVLVLSGCDEEDVRLAKLAQEAAQQQAEQNRAAAQLAQKTTENQRLMVESVEKSRQDLLGLQKSLSADQATLQQERAAVAALHRRESLLVPVFSSLGLLLVTSLPLVLCWYLLRGLQQEPPSEDAVSQLLLQEVIAEQPRLRLALPPTAAAHLEPVQERGALPAIEPPF